MKAKYNGGNNAIDQFIIEVKLIDPVKKIIDGLKNKSFRDCDISFLDKKLSDFTMFACGTLNIKGLSPDSIKRDRSGVTLNEFVTKQYIDRFTTILNYFKTF